MTAVLFRIFKTIAMVFVIALAAAAGFARWKLDGLAKTVAAQALAGTPLRSGHVHARVWPPAAVIDDLVVKSAAGDELLRAKKLVLPLGVGAWIGHGKVIGAPHAEGFLLRIRVRSESAAALPAGLPDWSEWDAEDGRVELRSGAGPAPVALLLTAVTASRHGARLGLDGIVDGDPSRKAHLEGEWRDGKLVAQAILGPLAATAAAPLLVGAPAVVRGGEVTFEGTVTLDATRAAFRGDVDARDVLVEGGATPGSFETRLRAGRGRARVPLTLDLALR